MRGHGTARLLKVQCAERATTGLRDAVVFDKLLGEGKVQRDEATGTFLHWLADPYDPQVSGPMTRNCSERDEYDALFPDHPLSRARAILRHLEATTRLASDIRGAAPFKFLPPEPKRKPWWKGFLGLG
ncbi:uncharacterized protein SOCE26_082000 [Sorangium cellulosum]|uniref:Uncharacterized protein n=1 Tax=Sorangium cellulosum TaxID=56 RepID=A0A2L0F568_SORCE|nr:hypothetical protein [Sorangium cellulosum]AUX46692.1 uncharacterized protein SOCE26_082000 [Sorangium cellulosum]